MFDITVTCERADPPIALVSATSRVGMVHGVPCPFEPEVFELARRFTTSIPNAVANRQLADDAASHLRQLLFGADAVYSLFERTRGAAAGTQGDLLVRLLPSPSNVAALPWELTGDPDGGAHHFLALAPDVLFARSPRVRKYPTAARPLPLPLRLLLILSSPPLAQPAMAFDVYEERRAILRELEPLVRTGLVQVTVEDRPSLQALRRCIAATADGFHVVHYVGHAGPGELILEDEGGRPRSVGVRQVTGLLQECRDLRLVVLAGCETAVHSDPSALLGMDWEARLSLTEQCVRDCCEAVIGMQAPLPRSSERTFVSLLYRSLVAGRPVSDALRLARAAVRDDRYNGFPRLDFAVPTLMLAGDSAAPIVDPATPPAPPPERRRARSRKPDLVEEDPELVPRHAQLRKLVDFMTGRTPERVLYVVGEPGVGKTVLVARAMQEVEKELDAVLYVTLPRLLRDATDATDTARSVLRRLTEDVADLLCEELAAREPERSWEALVEYIVGRQFLLVIDHPSSADERPTELELLTKALDDLISRLGQHRLVLVGHRGADDHPLRVGSRNADVLTVGALLFDDVHRWIGQHLPALSSLGEGQLRQHFRVLGSDLRAWRHLHRLIIEDPKTDISEHVQSAAARSRATAAPTSTAFEYRSIKVAVAGPFLKDRESAFADAVLEVAEQHRVSARLSVGGAATARPFGTLLDIASPFDDSGEANESAIVRWLEEVLDEEADIVLLDFATPEPLPGWDRLVRNVQELGSLVVATADAKPTFPAWYGGVIGVGALDEDGEPPADQWDAGAGKPDLFAPGVADDTPLARISHRSESRARLAALSVVVGAVIVWASRPSLKAQDVRGLLLDTATSGDGEGPRTFNLDAALATTRDEAVLRALRTQPIRLVDLVAATGLPPDVVDTAIERLIRSGHIERVPARAGPGPSDHVMASPSRP